MCGRCEELKRIIAEASHSETLIKLEAEAKEVARKKRVCPACDGRKGRQSKDCMGNSHWYDCYLCHGTGERP